MTQKRATVIYHSADFDGLFCGAIAKKFLGEEGVEYIGWNFGDKAVPIPADGDVYVMDLPVDRVFGFDYEKELGTASTCEVKDASPVQLLELRLIWIDHHKTSIDSHPPTLKGYRIDGVAACRLAWQWFNLGYGYSYSHIAAVGAEKACIAVGGKLPKKQDFIDRTVSEPLAVRLAGEYDIWDKRDPDVDVFQFGLKSAHNQEAMILSSIDGAPGLSPETIVKCLADDGRIIIRYQRQMDAEHVKRAFEFVWEGLKFCCYNGRGNSLTFESIKDESIEALMLIHFNGQKWMVSMYHTPWNKEIDLSVIAKKYGGGGHRGAGGFEVIAYYGGDEQANKFPFIPML